ncbi:hypothetical protein Q9B79_06620 [Bacillus sp. MHSD_36]|uniref:hypothetical protein n=1 Tax=unclassified Bacillus (in: firmicutes) TaxID=185979 RepID=UPI002740D98E|nr:MULTISPECIES: hypothetical protein [unclassified Bacillus (in: firmicutes)]MDP7989457.1 hypothetical protein [Bacillus sp. MHSD_36]MDR4977269.1 hypothetical protein [Bacillus sp. MHSD_37]
MNKQLFIKDNPFDKSQFEPVSNWLDRPDGGLWTADYNEGNGSAWLSSGTFHFESDNPPVGYVFSVNSQANILNLNTVKDALDSFPNYYISTFSPAPIRLDGTESHIGKYKIDFEKMAQTYDAIRVSHEVANGDVQHNGKYSPFAEWRIASTLWFNTNHLEQTDELSTEKLKELLMNARV